MTTKRKPGRPARDPFKEQRMLLGSIDNSIYLLEQMKICIDKYMGYVDILSAELKIQDGKTPDGAKGSMTQISRDMFFLKEFYPDYALSDIHRAQVAYKVVRKLVEVAIPQKAEEEE